MEHKANLQKLLITQIERCLCYNSFRSAVFVSSIRKLDSIVECLQIACDDLSTKGRVLRIRKSNGKCSVEFDNGSFLEIITARENSKGKRIHCALIDDTIDKDFLDCVLKPMLIPYIDKKYINDAILYFHL